MFCNHCGSDGHTENDGCTVKAATERILANWTPRGMTTGFVCPNCNTDGVWDWGPPGGSRFFVCQRCGAEVGHEKMAAIHAKIRAEIEGYDDGQISTEVQHSHRPSWAERWRRRFVHFLRADDEHAR